MPAEFERRAADGKGTKLEIVGWLISRYMVCEIEVEETQNSPH